MLSLANQMSSNEIHIFSSFILISDHTSEKYTRLYSKLHVIDHRSYSLSAWKSARRNLNIHFSFQQDLKFNHPCCHGNRSLVQTLEIVMPVRL